ncbi:MAG TPA: glycosyltransferase family 2 protein [Bacteroidales bacterium]|nr:glycosyltransferase family 2 protein [Bacteroidales bacterium]
MKKVSVIICAFNEEKTIREVILSVSKTHIVNEIVVVNDGSTDNTMSIIESLKQDIEITAIHLEVNMGKGYAMAVAVEYAIYDIMVFIDADQRVTPTGYITQLVSPLEKNECDMVLGYSTVNILSQDVNPLKILTGERALYKKDVTPILNKMKESRFGVETLLYFYYMALGKSLKFIRLEGMKHNDKYKKMTRYKATIDYINQCLEISNTAMKNYDLMLKTIESQVKKGLKL